MDQLLREEVSKILDREIEFPEGAIVTVTRVTASPDFLRATVSISALGGDERDILEILRKNLYHIQQFLNRRLRMRPVPKIGFAIDEEEMRREGVEQLLGALKRKDEL